MSQREHTNKRYGIKNNKVIEIYPHKNEKKIGRHNYYILWKTTKENSPGKTFHGKFYKSKEDALQNIKRRTMKKSSGGAKKRTVRKSKMKRNANSAYFEFRSGSSRKFWRIVRNGSKITTHYGKFGTLGQMTTKDYGSKVDQTFDSLIKSKKKKGYVEKTDYGDSNPKPPTNVEREYMKMGNKAEKSKVLNPNMINYDCEGMMDQGESELKWMTGWYKDALKEGEYDWDKYNNHYKTKRNKKRKK